MFSYLHKKLEIDLVFKILNNICCRLKDIVDFEILESELGGEVVAPRTVPQLCYYVYKK